MPTTENRQASPREPDPIRTATSARASSSSRRRPVTSNAAYSAGHTVAALAMAHELGLVEANRLRPSGTEVITSGTTTTARNRRGASAASAATRPTTTNPFMARTSSTEVSRSSPTSTPITS